MSHLSFNPLSFLHESTPSSRALYLTFFSSPPEVNIIRAPIRLNNVLFDWKYPSSGLFFLPLAESLLSRLARLSSHLSSAERSTQFFLLYPACLTLSFFSHF